MTCSTLPDVNMWLALALQSHVHHRSAWDWYQQLADEVPAMCRITQLGMLRMLTTQSIAGPFTCNQQEAWRVFERFRDEAGVLLLGEPQGLDFRFRTLADRTTPSPKEWTDSYLAAFAAAASLTLVTFDRALSQRARRSVLLV